MNENLVWRIGLVDIPTLALATGIGNLVLLILMWVYARTARNTHPSLKVWLLSRWAYVVALCLFWLRSVAPLWLTHVLAMFIITTGLALEFRAFQLLLGLRPPWRMIVAGVLLILFGRLLIHLSGMPAIAVVAYNSVALPPLLILLGILLIRQPRHVELSRFIGGNMILVGFLYLIRLMPLIWPDRPGVPTIESLHLALWIGCFLMVFINGYGYLLMVKQDDDEKLFQAMGELSLAEAEQRQLLSLASHEFRTPAAMIRTTLDSLAYLAPEISPAVAARHANIGHACQRLIHLANSLITQDRLRDLRFELVLEEVNLVSVVDEVVQRYAEPLVWAPPSAIFPVRLDPGLIIIALHNLIDNALRYSTPEHPPGVLLTRTRLGYELGVFDRGVGVVDAEKEKVFERFYRKDAGPGSGLGLSIVRQIAQLHGGDAVIRDQAPQGACFVIMLPEGKETAT
jgi:signal transduction histidine kinase